MRRSPANSTNRSLAAFGKLQHIHGESFRAYIEQILVPTLQPGDIFIADNPRGPQGRRHPAGPPGRRGHPLVLATL